MAKIFIGVGHGGSDPGACANGFKEKDLTLSISLECAEELKRHGVQVQMSRTTDVSEDLNDKVRRCNAYKPDYALDIHINAGGGDGAEIFHHYGGGKGKELGVKILDEMVKFGQNSRGLKIKKNDRGTDYFAFIRDTACPAIIVECAFIDNKKDIAIIDTLEKQKAMGVVIAKGVLAQLGIAWREKQVQVKEEKKENKTNSKVLEWQKAAIADGFEFPKYGADGMWGSECEAVAKRAVCKKPLIKGLYKNKNLTKFLQKQMGYKGNAVDGKFWTKTEKDLKVHQKTLGFVGKDIDGIAGYKTWKKELRV